MKRFTNKCISIFCILFLTLFLVTPAISQVGDNCNYEPKIDNPNTPVQPAYSESNNGNLRHFTVIYDEDKIDSPVSLISVIPAPNFQDYLRTISPSGSKYHYNLIGDKPLIQFLVVLPGKAADPDGKELGLHVNTYVVEPNSSGLKGIATLENFPSDITPKPFSSNAISNLSFSTDETTGHSRVDFSVDKAKITEDLIKEFGFDEAAEVVFDSTELTFGSGSAVTKAQQTGATIRFIAMEASSTGAPDIRYKYDKDGNIEPKVSEAPLTITVGNFYSWCKKSDCPDIDSDNDGTLDCKDPCPQDPTDKCEDLCPSDHYKTAPGVCGCGTPDTDSDGDGTPDCKDPCPQDPTDTCGDQCPNDPHKNAPLFCGCGTPDIDSDGDGTLDCKDPCPHDPKDECGDKCPNDPDKTEPGICGCGTPDTNTDSDGDGIQDCIDPCPYDPASDCSGDRCFIKGDSDGHKSFAFLVDERKHGNKDKLDLKFTFSTPRIGHGKQVLAITVSPNENHFVHGLSYGNGLIRDGYTVNPFLYDDPVSLIELLFVPAGEARDLDGNVIDFDHVVAYIVPEDTSGVQGLVFNHTTLVLPNEDPLKMILGPTNGSGSDIIDALSFKTNDTTQISQLDLTIDIPKLLAEARKVDPNVVFDFEILPSKALGLSALVRYIARISGSGDPGAFLKYDGQTGTFEEQFLYHIDDKGLFTGEYFCPGDQDNCPNDPNKTEPGICGCGTPDTDSDGDGTPDCNDQCPHDSGKIVPGVCGCGKADVDSNGDGTYDCEDRCTLNPGLCGCSISDIDSDGDGLLDCEDGCPDDKTKSEPGICGCGTPDTDSDGDGTPDCHDDCNSSTGSCVQCSYKANTAMQAHLDGMQHAAINQWQRAASQLRRQAKKNNFNVPAKMLRNSEQKISEYGAAAWRKAWMEIQTGQFSCSSSGVTVSVQDVCEVSDQSATLNSYLEDLNNIKKETKRIVSYTKKRSKRKKRKSDIIKRMDQIIGEAEAQIATLSSNKYICQ